MRTALSCLVAASIAALPMAAWPIMAASPVAALTLTAVAVFGPAVFAIDNLVNKPETGMPFQRVLAAIVVCVCCALFLLKGVISNRAIVVIYFAYMALSGLLLIANAAQGERARALVKTSENTKPNG